MYSDRVDGVFLPNDVTASWNDKEFNSIPLLIGSQGVPHTEGTKYIIKLK